MPRWFERRSICSVEMRLLRASATDVLPHGLWADFGAVDRTGRIDGDALGAAGRGLIRVRLGIRDERRDAAVASTADVDTALEARIATRVRFRVRRVQHVVAV